MGEIALIEAQWIHQTDCDFQCLQKAQKESIKHNIPMENALTRQRLRGKCDNRTLTMENGVVYHKCFCSFSHSQFDAFYRVWDCYEKGILPFPGTVFEQPAWVFDVIELFSRLKYETQEREQEKQNKKKG